MKVKRIKLESKVMKNAAIIHATLAASSVASPYYYDINITQQLCHPACVDENPVFTPQFSVLSIELVGTSQYLINCHVEGTVHYILCGCSSCSTRAQVISQDFSIPVFSAAAITAATVAAGVSSNVMAKEPCQKCSKTFVSDTPITLTTTSA